MASTTWVGGSSGNETDWATGANWSTGSVPTTSAHVVIPNTTHNCALDQSRTIGSLTIESGGTIVGGGFTLFIQSEGDAAGGTEHFAVNNDGIISGELNLNITTPATTSCDFAGSTGKFHDVTINHASCQVNLESTTQFTGNLTITLGKIVCGGNTVEITGRTDIGPASGAADQATLQCDASAMFLGSGRTSSFALVVNQGGTFDGGSGNHTIGSIEVKNNSNAKMDFTSANTTVDSEKTGDNRNIVTNVNSTVTHSNGTIIMTFAGNTEISWESTTSGNEGPYNFTVNHASAIQRSRRSPFRVLNDLTITAGEYNTLSGDSGADLDLTVTGNVIIAAAGTLTCNSSTVIANSITISANGTLDAPDASGSLTLNGTLSAWSFQNNSTNFNHNNGTITQTNAGHINL